MASLSASAAQIHVIRSATSSERNEFLKKRSLMYSNGVPFGLSAPHSSSFLTLKSSCDRIAIFPVAAVAKGKTDRSSYDEAKRLATEATERLMKEAANLFPQAKDDVELERLVKEAARRLVKQATGMFVGTSTEEFPDNLKRSVEDGRLTPLQALVVHDYLEVEEDRRLGMEIANAMAKRKAIFSAERLVKEAADMFAAENKSDNEDTMASGMDAFIDEVCGLIKPYVLTSNRAQVHDFFVVADYIWTRVRMRLSK